MLWGLPGSWWAPEGRGSRREIGVMAASRCGDCRCPGCTQPVVCAGPAAPTEAEHGTAGRPWCLGGWLQRAGTPRPQDEAPFSPDAGMSEMSSLRGSRQGPEAQGRVEAEGMG